MSETSSITVDSPICKVLTCIPEKFVVDFANGIDVARDHVRVQKERGSFFARFYDGLSGKGDRRQAEVNVRLIDGVEASLTWLSELTESLSASNLAIARVNDRINEIKYDVAGIANFSVDTRRSVNALVDHIDKIRRAHEERLDFIELESSARANIDSVFEKWRAGRYGCFTPAGRCYAALEELRWGTLGSYLHRNGRQSRDFLQIIQDKATSQLRDDVKAPSSDLRFETSLCWLAVPNARDVLLDSAIALAYMGDCFDEDMHPYAFSTSQQKLSGGMPLICSAKRLSEGLVSDVFGDCQYG